MQPPESRSAVLYARITPTNKKFIKSASKDFPSESEFVDAMISLHKAREENHARNARCARRRTPKAK
jgi:hypothetical protein